MRCQYPLINIIVITPCGLICGADNWKAIELVAKKRQRWLKKILDLSNGKLRRLMPRKIAAVYRQIHSVQQKENEYSTSSLW